MRDVELTLACVQMTSGENRDSNVQKAEHYIDIAIKEHNADVIVLPEFFNIPYVFQWRDYKHIDRAEHASGPTI